MIKAHFVYSHTVNNLLENLLFHCHSNDFLDLFSNFIILTLLYFLFFLNNKNVLNLKNLNIQILQVLLYLSFSVLIFVFPQKIYKYYKKFHQTIFIFCFYLSSYLLVTQSKAFSVFFSLFENAIGTNCQFRFWVIGGLVGLSQTLWFQIYLDL